MQKKFEKFQGSYFLFFLLLVCLFYSIFYLSQHFYKTYYVLSATVSYDNTIQFLANRDVLYELNKNKTIYIEGKKYRVSIQNIIRNILEKDSISYHQVELSVLLPDKYQVYDVIQIMIYDEEESLLTIFKSCLKGDDYEKNR